MTDTIRNRPTIAHGPWMDMDGVCQRLKKLTKVLPGGQAAWAKRHGISKQYVNHVLLGRKPPGEKITKAMGLERALLWRTPSR